MNGKIVMTANWEFVPDLVVCEHKDPYVFDVETVTIGSSIDVEGNAYRYFKGNISNIEIMVKEDINKKN